MGVATESVMDAINQIWKEYASSFSEGDIDRWMSLWTDDGVQMPPEAPANVGKEKIRAANKETLDHFAFDMRITNEEIQVAGGWAFSRGTYTATMTPKNGGKDIPIDGKYMTILKRQTDGSWKIHRDCFNSNVPPAHT